MGNEYFTDGEKVIRIEQRIDTEDHVPFTHIIYEREGSRFGAIPIVPDTEDEPLVVYGAMCAGCSRLVALYELDYLCDSCRVP